MDSIKSERKPDVSHIIYLAIAAVAVAGLAVLPQLNNWAVLTGTSVLMYVVLSVSWTMFSGEAGYVSLATAAFFGLGVYITAMYNDYLPLPALMLVGGAAAFIIAVMMGAITLRLRGVYFTIFTFGLVELLKELVLWIEVNFFHTRGRFNFNATPGETLYYYLLGLVVVLLVVAFIMKRSRFGKSLVSIRESEDAAAHIGINTTLVKILAFAISSFFMGAVGAAIGSNWPYIDPGTAFNSMNTFLPVLMVIFGGTRNLAGPVIGATVFAWLQDILRVNFSLYYMISIGAIMVIAILFMPDGLVGLGHYVYSSLRSSTKNAGQGSKQKRGSGDADA